MGKLCFTLICIILTGCNVNLGGDSSKSDPLYGSWAYDLPGSTSSNARGSYVKIEENGNIQLYSVYATGNSNSAVVYSRKNIGKFTRNGDKFSIKYSYETCSPVGSEVLKFKISPNNSDSLIASNEDESVQLMYYRAKSSSSSPLSIANVEDKNCNIVLSLKKDERKPASDSKKSFFTFPFDIRNL